MSSERQQPESADIGDLFEMIADRRRLIAGFVAAVTGMAIVISLLLPRSYVAGATILPPKNQNIFSSIGLSSSSLARQFSPLRALATPGTSSDIYNYLAILRSRTLLVRVVQKFDLPSVYSVRKASQEDAIEQLLSNVDFKVGEEGTLRVEVYDQDSTRAAAMANYFVTLLDELNRDLAVREARSNREFIEERVALNVSDLKQAEDTLKAFQEKNAFIMPTEQTSNSVGSIASLFAERTKKEIEVNVLKRTLSADNPQLETEQVELAEMDRKLRSLPGLGTGYLRLYRNYLVQQRLFETLLPLLEQAKIEERRDMPTLLVLDSATIPERAARPKRMIIVLVACVMSIVVSIGSLLLFYRLAVLKKQAPFRYQRLEQSLRKLLSLSRSTRAS